MEKLDFIKNKLIEKVLLLAHQIKNNSSVLLEQLNNLNIENLSNLSEKKNFYIKQLTEIATRANDIIIKLDNYKNDIYFNEDNLAELINDCDKINNSYQDFLIINKELFISNYIIDDKGNLKIKEEK